MTETLDKLLLDMIVRHVDYEEKKLSSAGNNKAAIEYTSSDLADCHKTVSNLSKDYHLQPAQTKIIFDKFYLVLKERCGKNYTEKLSMNLKYRACRYTESFFNVYTFSLCEYFAPATEPMNGRKNGNNGNGRK
jgi:hypothetical protein